MYPSYSNIEPTDPFLQGDGGDSLQTDVMRFMAILGFCLLAIFALVQSLPQDDPQREALSAQISQLTQQREQHRAELSQLHQQLEQAAARAQQMAQSARESATTIQQQRRQIEALSGQLASATEQRKSSREAQAQRWPSDTTQPAKLLRQPGFTLRFASDQVLLQLIRQRHIKFFAISGEMAWRATSALSYIEQRPPSQIHEMSTATVPSALINALPTSRADEMTWGVVLPAAIHTEIKQLMQQYRQGDLVIDRHGKVHIKGAVDED
ncbi:hypothetical protein [Candidatus Endoriftia persephonae]|jgi:cell division protein FtsB|uniref:Uncharacterized protein n=2 Tax=Gammaproteobacteria TaxID=1236 RepID=G2FCB0_9GAMM|nr:hypothetical protein [Candidatus Endoriftia persephone]EGW55473.1 hypothetical protein TevJSym_ac00360 [endosymbiont of Tevnia jerichonana (vent Tica)]USF86629.1 hypothetical protein L0Y14_10820 [Candidatus Endoriftia persephone]